MIQMDDACDPKLVALRELGQEIGEGNRVGAARQRDEHAGIRTRQIVRANGRADAVDETASLWAGKGRKAPTPRRLPPKKAAVLRLRSGRHPEQSRGMPEDRFELSTPRL